MWFYHLDDKHLLDMPLARFWVLETNLSKLQAERDLRQLRLLCGAQANAKDLQTALSKELGSVVVETEPKRDEEGVKRLKSLASLQLGG